MAPDTLFVAWFASGGPARNNRGACRSGGAAVRGCTGPRTRVGACSYGEVAGKWWIS